MPKYDYRCRECRETFEIERSMSDPTQTTCLFCNSTDVARIWNLFMQTKGTPDVGQGSSRGSSSAGNCGSCSTHSCGTCH